MTPATEYLLRTNSVRNWFETPCSLFLTERQNRSVIVVSISDEFKPSDFYSVKHWKIGTCQKDQALPSMEEHRVKKTELFQSPKVILTDHKILPYQISAVPCRYNCFVGGGPMSRQRYEYYMEGNDLLHQRTRMDWLWKQFATTYNPDLFSISYILRTGSLFRSDASIAEDQRDLFSRFMKKEWKYWKLWQKNMLLNPGEFVFQKEYH